MEKIKKEYEWHRLIYLIKEKMISLSNVHEYFPLTVDSAIYLVGKKSILPKISLSKILLLLYLKEEGEMTWKDIKYKVGKSSFAKSILNVRYFLERKIIIKKKKRMRIRRKNGTFMERDCVVFLLSPAGVEYLKRIESILSLLLEIKYLEDLMSEVK